MKCLFVIVIDVLGGSFRSKLRHLTHTVLLYRGETCHVGLDFGQIILLSYKIAKKIADLNDVNAISEWPSFSVSVSRLAAILEWCCVRRNM